MSEKEVKSHLEKVVELIGEENLNKPLIELNERKANEELWDHLEEMGTIHTKFQVSQEPMFSSINTLSGQLHIVHKRLDGSWVIKLYLIKEYLGK